MTQAPDYYRPWPDSWGYQDNEPDWYDDQVYKERIEQEDLEEDLEK